MTTVRDCPTCAYHRLQPVPGRMDDRCDRPWPTVNGGVQRNRSCPGLCDSFPEPQLKEPKCGPQRLHWLAKD